MLGFFLKRFHCKVFQLIETLNRCLQHTLIILNFSFVDMPTDKTFQNLTIGKGGGEGFGSKIS